MSEPLNQIQKRMDDWRAQGRRVASLSDDYPTYDELYEHHYNHLLPLSRADLRAYQHADGMFVTGIDSSPITFS